MVLEVYYLDYTDAFSASQQMNYVNLNSADTQSTKTTMTEADLYNPNGTVGGTTEIISFTRKSTNITLTSFFSVFTESGLLVFNIARLYTKNYNPETDSVKAVATYQSGKYATGNPVYMSLDTEIVDKKTILKLSISY